MTGAGSNPSFGCHASVAGGCHAYVVAGCHAFESVAGPSVPRSLGGSPKVNSNYCSVELHNRIYYTYINIIKQKRVYFLV